jgi:tripartite-type tricarboxylate transporter receptor subunit TctC
MSAITRRHFIAGSAAMAAAAPSSHSFAATDYPNRPVRYVVAYAPGGTSDLVGRIVAKGLSDRLGQQFFVDNRPGGGGIIGVDYTSKAPADGYTLLHTSASFFTVTPQLTKVTYDAEKDFDPVAFIGTNVDVLAVNMDLPVTNLQEFLAYAKANPGKLLFGSSGPGTGNHIECEYLKQIAGIDAKHIPYKGAAPAILDVVAGRTHFIADPGVMPFVTSGKLRPIAVIARTTLPQLPGVPSIRSVLSDWNCPEWYNFVSAPKGVSAEIKEKLNTAVAASVTDPQATSTMLANCYAPGTSTVEALIARVRSDMGSIGGLLQSLNIALG